MSSIDESSFDDLDRTFLNLSGRISDGFYWAYGMLCYRLVSPLDPEKFDNASSKIKEVASRIFIALGTFVSISFAGTIILFSAVVLGALCKTFRAMGFALQKQGYTHIRGSAPEISLQNGQATVMTWNIRGDQGGMHFERGLVHWRSRIDKIIATIKREDPDLLVLQEIYDPALAEAIIEKMGDSYAHFFTHLGANTWGNSGGVMVLSKCAVHEFTHTDFINNEWSTNKGFETLAIKLRPEDTLPCLRLMGTHLSEGDQNKEKRMEQLSQIITKLQKEKLNLPTLLAGNLANRDSLDEGQFLSKYLYHSYQDKEPTRSDQLALQWNPSAKNGEEIVDFISFFKRNPPEDRPLPVVEKDIRLINCYKIKVDENNSTKNALSDHDPVVSIFNGLKEASLNI